MTPRVAVADLDPFSRRQLADITRRWLDERNDHQTRERQAWLGVMLTRFTAHELEILEAAGSLSESDRGLLAEARQHTSGEDKT